MIRKYWLDDSVRVRRSILREAFPTAALAMTNPLWSGLGLNAALHCDRWATNRLSTAMTYKCSKKFVILCTNIRISLIIPWVHHFVMFLMTFIHIQRHRNCLLHFKMTCLCTDKGNNTHHLSAGMCYVCTSFVKIYVTKRLILRKYFIYCLHISYQIYENHNIRD